MKQKENNQEESGIIAQLNNKTGETQFEFSKDNASSTIVSMLWDFGDGVTLQGFSPYHRYSKAGNYTVTVTITDDQGTVSMKSFDVNIPEPEESVDTRIGATEDTSSVPWIMILVGIVISLVATIVLIKFRL